MKCSAHTRANELKTTVANSLHNRVNVYCTTLKLCLLCRCYNREYRNYRCRHSVCERVDVNERKLFTCLHHSCFAWCFKDILLNPTLSTWWKGCDSISCCSNSNQLKLFEIELSGKYSNIFVVKIIETGIQCTVRTAEMYKRCGDNESGELMQHTRTHLSSAAHAATMLVDKHGVASSMRRGHRRRNRHRSILLRIRRSGRQRLQTQHIAGTQLEKMTIHRRFLGTSQLFFFLSKRRENRRAPRCHTMY